MKNKTTSGSPEVVFSVLPVHCLVIKTMVRETTLHLCLNKKRTYVCFLAWHAVQLEHRHISGKSLKGIISEDPIIIWSIWFAGA